MQMALRVAQVQMRPDFTAPHRACLARHRSRALALGANELPDRSGDGEEPLYVFADPEGHPFCILVG